MIKFLLGMLAFAAAQAFAQGEISIPQIMSDPKAFYGRTMTVTGVAGGVRTSVRTVDFKTRQQAQFYSFSLYEQGGSKGRGKYYVSVNVPASSFRYVPREGDAVSITGELKPPLNVGSIGL
jgi:hypothetical protein